MSKDSSNFNSLYRPASSYSRSNRNGISPTTSPYQMRRRLPLPGYLNNNNPEDNTTMSPRSRMIDILSQAEQIVSTPSPVSRTSSRGGLRSSINNTSRNTSTWMNFCADLPFNSSSEDDETDETEEQQQQRQQHQQRQQ